MMSVAMTTRSILRKHPTFILVLSSVLPSYVSYATVSEKHDISAPKMETACFSETTASYKTTRLQNRRQHQHRKNRLEMLISQRTLI
jgi:hypothetical protein